MVMTVLFSGARISILLAARVDDVDFEKGEITLRRRLSAGELIEGVKRRRTARDHVALPNEVLEILRAHIHKGPAGPRRSSIGARPILRWRGRCSATSRKRCIGTTHPRAAPSDRSRRTGF
jgi:integrase